MTKDNFNIKKQVEIVLADLEIENIKNIFFVSVGGSFALMYLSKYIIDHEAMTLEAHVYSSNEFAQCPPIKLNKNSIVLLCSNSGNTPETTEAAEVAQSRGATTISLTNQLGTKIPKACDFNLKYESEEEDALYSSHSVLYQITFGILAKKENNNKYDSVVGSLSNLQHILEKNQSLYNSKAIDFANSHRNEKLIYTIASGVNFGPAYGFAICSLMEQQWIHSNAIHAGEYFHGPFEITDEDVPFVILLGLSKTRVLDERALNFLRNYASKITVLDAENFYLEKVDNDIRNYISALIHNFLVRFYSKKLSEVREHPLATRRYMGVVDY